MTSSVERLHHYLVECSVKKNSVSLAEGKRWFDKLTKEQKELYVRMHPRSKFAKHYKVIIPVDQKLLRNTQNLISQNGHYKMTTLKGIKDDSVHAMQHWPAVNNTGDEIAKHRMMIVKGLRGLGFKKSSKSKQPLYVKTSGDHSHRVYLGPSSIIHTVVKK
jgi:hypothetical protein